MILHCMKKSTWDQRKDQAFWGAEELSADGFIHCSPVEYFWRIAPHFQKMTDALVLLVIDETKLTAQVRYEDGDGCGRLYPHVYGLINNDAIIDVLPYLKDSAGNFIKNPELAGIEDQ